MALKNEVVMTEGNLLKKMFIVALPLMFTSLLQIFYNTADLIVCGLFGSSHSVAAISSTTSLSFLIINLFIGLSIGANVVFARCFGLGNQEKGNRVVQTSLCFSIVFGFAGAIIGFTLARTFLGWMNSPEDVIDLSTLYMKIYFLGMPFSMIYNFGSALLRATGDTKRPFFILTSSGLVNVGLNLLLVIVFGLDVAGVAIATITAQAMSAILVLICMARNKGFLRLNLRHFRFYKKEALEIIYIGIPASIQSLAFSLSNVVIQSSVNSLGANVMDGNGAAASLEGFIFVAMDAFSQAALVFVSANYAVKNFKFIKKTILYACTIVVLLSVTLGSLFYIFDEPLIKLYVRNEEAIEAAKSRLVVFCFTYFTCAIMNILANSQRGMGKSLEPSIVTVAGVVGFRFVWIFIFFPKEAFHSLFGIAISYPISWIITGLIHLVLIIVFYKKDKAKYELTTII